MTRRGKTMVGFVVMVLSCLMAMAETGPGKEAATREYQLKAVFLFHFVQFVEWPDSIPQPDSSIVIGILGADPFGPFIEEAVQGESIKGRPIRVKRFKDIDAARECRILFISASENGRLEKTLDALKQSHVLTVGESEEFSLSGGMIRFTTEQSRIRLKINLEAVQGANLTMSSKLLRLADIVKPRKG